MSTGTAAACPRCGAPATTASGRCADCAIDAGVAEAFAIRPAARPRRRPAAVLLALAAAAAVLLVAAVLALALVGPSTESAAALARPGRRWVAVSGPGFSAEMPGRATVTSAANGNGADSAGAPRLTTTYGYLTGRFEYGISTATLPAGSVDDDTLLRSAVDGAATGVKGAVLASDAATVGGTVARTFTIRAGRRFSRGFVLRVASTLVVVLHVSDAAAPPPDFRRFVASFQLAA